MVDELLKYPKALALSVLFHLVIIIAIVINFEFFDKPKLVQTGTQVKAIQAQVIDSKQLEQSKQKENIEKADQRKKQREKIALEQKAKELEQKKAKEKKQKAEAQKKKLEKQKKESKAKEQAAIKKKEDAKKKQKLEAQKKAQVEKKEAKEKAAKEKIKQAKEKQAAEAQARAKKKEALEKKKEAERKLAEAVEKKQLAEEKKRQEAEKRRQAEQEQKRKEAELKAQLKAEESSRRLSSLKAAYVNAIRQKVERNWRRPQQSAKIESCEVRVLQGPGGIILDVTFGDCRGGTNAYRASIENAVYKAEPLPQPGDAALFEREINFIFSPK